MRVAAFLLMELLVLLLLLYINVAAATNFEQVPQDRNHVLGSTAQFTCRVSDQDNCQLLRWRFTGSSDGAIIRTTGRTTTVTLDASMVNNGTMIECGCRYSSTHTDYTPPAQLLVQGLLDPPSNLQINSQTVNAIELAWDIPFTLDLTGIHPDITGYKISVENINIGNITNFIVTSPPFTLVCEGSDQCSSVRLSVFGLNALGEGRQSNIVTAHYLETMTVSDPTLEIQESEATEAPSFSTTNEDEQDLPTLVSATPSVYTDEISTASTSFNENTSPSLISTTSAPANAPETNTALIIGIAAIVGGCLLCCIILLIVVVAVMAAKYNRNLESKVTSAANEAPRVEPIYESAGKVEAYIAQTSSSEKPEPYYTLPLPTDGCVAYGALKKTLNN